MSNNSRRSSERVAFIIEYLENHYQTEGPDNCAVFLKEPVNYIRGKAASLGLIAPKPVRPIKETEVERLRRQNDEFRASLFKSSKKVVDREKIINNLKNEILPAIKLINQYRWEIKKLKEGPEIWQNCGEIMEMNNKIQTEEEVKP